MMKEVLESSKVASNKPELGVVKQLIPFRSLQEAAVNRPDPVGCAPKRVLSPESSLRVSWQLDCSCNDFILRGEK